MNIKNLLTPILLALSLFISQLAFGEKISSLPHRSINGCEYYYYEVKPKETIFSLTKRFGITERQLIEYNPAVADGLKAHSTLYFPMDVFGDGLKPTVEQKPAATGTKEVTIQKGQSIYGIAYENGVSVEEILALNPNLNTSYYKAGEVILVPVKDGVASADKQPSYSSGSRQTDDSRPRNDNISLPVISDNDREQDFAEEKIDSVVIVETDTFTVSLMLPLQLQASVISPEASLYTDFYKGFLLGVRENETGESVIKINVLDTDIDDDSFNRLLLSNDVFETDLFIGPASEAQLANLSKKATETEANILNVFVINSDLYHSNPNIFQMNIPSEFMFEGAATKFIELFKDVTPVFIARVDGEADKVIFTDYLKEKLRENGKTYKEIVFSGVLTADDLHGLTASDDYVFVPASGSRREFGKFVSGIKEFKEMSSGNVSVFGYPDWTSLRGEQFQQLGDLNAVIYSRYYTDPTDAHAASIGTRYKEWYGEEWNNNIVPNQVLLGYDIACYAINALRKSDGNMVPAGLDHFSGIQSDFHNVRLPQGNAGTVNQALFIMNYKPTGRVKKDVIDVPLDITLAR